MLLAFATAAAQPAPDQPRLSGIVITGQARVALFDTGGGTVQAEVGDRVGPYVVRAIEPEAVQAERDGEAVVLGLAGGGAPVFTDHGGVTFGLVVNRQGPPPD